MLISWSYKNPGKRGDEKEEGGSTSTKGSQHGPTD